MLKKTPAANVAIAMSLEELDRSSYCPGKTSVRPVIPNQGVAGAAKYWNKI